jgi:hypothetical protein
MQPDRPFIYIRLILLTGHRYAATYPLHRYRTRLPRSPHSHLIIRESAIASRECNDPDVCSPPSVNVAEFGAGDRTDPNIVSNARCDVTHVTNRAQFTCFGRQAGPEPRRTHRSEELKRTQARAGVRPRMFVRLVL